MKIQHIVSTMIIEIDDVNGWPRNILEKNLFDAYFSLSTFSFNFSIFG